jgi:hypothetical protein
MVEVLAEEGIKAELLNVSQRMRRVNLKLLLKLDADSGDLTPAKTDIALMAPRE